ncbi:permease [Roseitalea porphyridii]|uniref:Permease n=1 Tax=Roseitalea porphyridii TaxID=1852022 RepID=A0A4V1A3S8_9HYPH|nr:permease [Roseitalea porphyridii]QBK30168.1 permease [Roseitalea porphyridii]
MSIADTIRATRPTVRHVYGALAVILVALIAWQPVLARDTVIFAVTGLIDVTPIVIPGVLLAAWMMASGASDRVARLFEGRTVHTVVSATVIGALLPVCGITVLPLMAGLLAAGVPLAPVMAFWLASPITGPAMLAATIATLGWQFAIGKALAAIGLGLLGGLATSLFAGRGWAKAPLRSNRLVASLGAPCGASGNEPAFEPRLWRSAERRRRFVRQCWSIGRLIVIVLVPAFAAEFLLNAWLAPDALSAYVGRDNPMAVPLAVIVGGPAYIDGYAALPLTRALLEAGMSPGAAMAFLVSGGVASVWGAMAIVPVLRLQPFLLYLALAAVGSMLSGWAFGLAS